MPLSRPSKLQLRAAVVHVWPPGCAVTRYWDTGAPLSWASSQDTVADWSPRVAETEVGGDGAVGGATGSDGSDGPEAPTALVAVTVTVCGLSVSSPLSVQD